MFFLVFLSSGDLVSLNRCFKTSLSSLLLHDLLQVENQGFLDPMTDSRPWHLPPSSSPPPNPPSSAISGNGCTGGNVDRVLFKNLVEMVPLVESLMDKRANSSFTRRASMVYTPAPSHLKKISDFKTKKVAQTDSIKKQRHTGELFSDDFSVLSSKSLAEESVHNDKSEIIFLQDQIDELKKKLVEKEEALKSTENLVNEVNTNKASLVEFRRQVSEKDALIKSTNTQLYDAKIKLADKEAVLEKLQWEAQMLNKKVEELQGDVILSELEISALMQLFEVLANSDSFASAEGDIAYFEPLPNLDDYNARDVDKMEEARLLYLAAVAVAKENPSDEAVAAAAEARRTLQSIVL